MHFVATAVATPLFNQTKHLTAAQARKSYGKRWEEFARVRAKWDPDDRLLSRYFADLLDDIPIA